MKRRYIFIALVLVMFLCHCGGSGKNAPLTGLIDATEIDVASKIPGRIKALAVQEGDAVTEGQELLTIESLEINAKVDQVNALVDAAKAKLKMAQNGAREEEKRAAARQMEAAQHQVDLTKKMYDRMASLLSQNAIPKAKYDEVEFQYNVSQEQFAMAKAKYDATMKGARDEEIEALEALVRQGEGTLAEVNSYNSETAQNAPISGEVSKIALHKGELAATGYPILTIVDLKDMWATFAVREDLLQGIKKGSRIKVEIPALGKEIEMEIFLLSPLGDFATWRATSERNNFDLKSFEVKARPVTPVEGLRPGMTARWRSR